jgi:hypothetical protein
MSVTVELTFEQVVSAVEQLSPGELETLAIMFDPELAQELETRLEQARKEAAAGELLTVEELFEEFD